MSECKDSYQTYLSLTICAITWFLTSLSGSNQWPYIKSMKRCNRCVWTKNNQQVQDSLLASTRISPSPLASCLSLSLVAPCFSPGTFSPAATSAAQWLRRSWSWGTAPLPSAPWWCLRRGGGQERIGVQGWETSRRRNMQMCRMF